MAKRRRRRKKNNGKSVYLLGAVVAALVICVLIAAIQNKRSEVIMTDQSEVESETAEKDQSANEQESLAQSDTSDAEEASEPQDVPKEEPSETPSEEPATTESSEEEDSSVPAVETSDETTMNADGTTWTSFDGITLGNPTSTYGALYGQSEIAALDGSSQGYGQGVNVDENNRPVGAINLQDKYGKYGAIYIAEASSNLYLTFDEGYENGYTSAILDTLKAKDCKAVFFVTMDYAKKNPDLIQRMINEGHVVGNHSVSHKSMPSLSLEEASTEITGLHNYIKETYNYDMYLFRPPMGEFSEQTLALAQSLGYRTVLWSYAYRDYDTAAQPDQTEAFGKITAAKHGGAVYLLHAVSATNTAILGNVIDDFRNGGYVVGPIPR